MTHVLSAAGSSPDFTRPLALVTLLCAILVLPLYLWGLIGVIRHRKTYPIAGRGSTYLICHATTFLLAHLLLSVVQMTHPLGVPCGMQFVIILVVTFPHVYCYMLRGWILIFRLEIQNFLQETHWKEEQMETRLAKEQDTADVAEAEKLVTPTVTPVVTDIAIPIIKPLLVTAGTELELSLAGGGGGGGAAASQPTPSSSFGESITLAPVDNRMRSKPTGGPTTAPSPPPTNTDLPAQVVRPFPYHGGGGGGGSIGALPFRLFDPTSAALAMMLADPIEQREGYWFIVSRRYIEPLWLAMYAAAFTCLAVICPARALHVHDSTHGHDR